VSECEVDFGDYSDDADPVEMYDATFVVGRKAHTCTECGDAIPKGIRHQRISYRFDGRFWTDRRCPPCQETAGEFNHCIIGGMLWQAFQEEWENGAHLQACLNRLTTADAKAHMQRQWTTWHERKLERARKRTPRGQEIERGTNRR
jgi:hypothetical protein